MLVRFIHLAGIVLLIGGCGYGSSYVREESDAAWVACPPFTHEPDEGVRIECGNSVAARIWALINQGKFAEAEALIIEARAAGLVTAPMAAQMRDRVAMLSTKVEQLHATLQRAPDFPTQLRGYTLFDIIQMLNRKDFSLATQSQLKMVKKLLEQPDRLMGK